MSYLNVLNRYRAAAAVLYGDDLGRWLYDRFDHHNRQLWNRQLQPIPIYPTVHAPYGRWIGLSCDSKHGRAIWLHSVLLISDRASGTTSSVRLPEARRSLDDVLLHEMLHQILMQRNVPADHKYEPWRSEITRITATFDPETIDPRYRNGLNTQTWISKRITYKNGKKGPGKVRNPDALTDKEIARWPHTIRTDGYYQTTSEA